MRTRTPRPMPRGPGRQAPWGVAILPREVAVAAPKMPNSGSWAVGTCLRCPSHLGGSPRLAQAARLERRAAVRYTGPSEGVLTSHHPKQGQALRVLVGGVALGRLS
jgi:hypothetical protein